MPKLVLPLFSSIVILVIIFISNQQLRAAEWNFAVISDTQNTGSSGVNTAAITAVAADIVNNRDCAFVLIAGDLVNGESKTSDLLVDQYVTFKDTATTAGLKVGGSSGSGVPYYPVRGNHNVYNNSVSKVDTAVAWQNAFTTLPQNGPDTVSDGGGNSEVGLTYSFTCDNTLFLALDEYINAADSLNPNVNQDWIDEQLAGSTAQHIIAFGHTPAYQAYHDDCLAVDQAGRDAFLTSLYNAGGRLYLAGHDHFAALARVYEKAPAAGGAQGFYQVIDGTSGGSPRTFDGAYNDDYALDYSVTDLYHDGDSTTHYSYAVVTINDDLLWLRMYGTVSLTTINWQLLHSLVISGTLTGDTSTLTSNVTNDATIAFNQTSDGTYASTISGTGNVTKSGSGTLTLSMPNTYTGTTTINAGTLSVTGNITSSAVTVNSGGILKGTGDMKSITNYGIVKPGNSVGTLKLNGGAFNQGPSGTLEIEVESTSSYDKITGASTASLDGTLKTITSGSYTIGDTLSGVIRTSGGITGAFSFLDTPITPTIAWEPQTNGNNLDLVAARDYNNDALSVTLTTNQKSVAALMQGILPSATSDLSTIKSIIDSFNTNGQVAQAYSQMSAEKLNGIPLIAFSNIAAQFNHLQGHLRRLRSGEENDANFQWRGETSKILLAYEGDDWGKFIPPSCEHKEELTRAEVSENTSESPSKHNKLFGFFINSENNYGKRNLTDTQPGFHYYTTGINAGLDYRFTNNSIGGIQSGYARTDSDLGGSGGKVDVDSLFCGAYGTYYNDNFYVEGASNFSYSFYDTARNIDFGGLNRKAKADTTGQQCNLLLGTGYDFQLRDLTSGPNLTAKYSRFWIDSFSESGADTLGLNISDQRAESFQLGLGWSAEYKLEVGKKTFLPQAQISYQHEFCNGSRLMEAQLAGAGGIFQTETGKPTRDFALVGCGILAKLSISLSLDIKYQAQVGQDDYIVHSLDGALAISF